MFCWLLPSSRRILLRLLRSWRAIAASPGVVTFVGFRSRPPTERETSPNRPRLKTSVTVSVAAIDTRIDSRGSHAEIADTGNVTGVGDTRPALPDEQTRTLETGLSSVRPLNSRTVPSTLTWSPGATAVAVLKTKMPSIETDAPGMGLESPLP